MQHDAVARGIARLVQGRPLPPSPVEADLATKVAVLEEAVETLKSDYQRLETKLNMILAAVVLSPFAALLVQRLLR